MSSFLLYLHLTSEPFSGFTHPALATFHRSKEYDVLELDKDSGSDLFKMALQGVEGSSVAVICASLDPESDPQAIYPFIRLIRQKDHIRFFFAGTHPNVLQLIKKLPENRCVQVDDPMQFKQAIETITPE